MELKNGFYTALGTPLTENGDLVAASMCLDVNALDKIFTYADVTRIAPAECCVYADNRLIGFFPREDARFVLPYCFCSNFYMTMNARELCRLVCQMAFGRGANMPEIRPSCTIAFMRARAS